MHAGGVCVDGSMPTVPELSTTGAGSRLCRGLAGTWITLGAAMGAGEGDAAAALGTGAGEGDT